MHAVQYVQSLMSAICWCETCAKTFCYCFSYTNEHQTSYLVPVRVPSPRQFPQDKMKISTSSLLQYLTHGHGLVHPALVCLAEPP